MGTKPHTGARKEVRSSGYYGNEGYAEALRARRERVARTEVNKDPKHAPGCRKYPWNVVLCAANCEIDIIEVDKKLITLLTQHGIKVTQRFPDGIYPAPRLACYIPVWAWQLYSQCRGWKLHDGIPGPWSSIFEYAARRAAEDDEFQHALAAAMDAEVLVKFIQQQRHVG